MNSATSNGTLPGKRIVRCAAYTRKSSEEGLQQDYNSLDAQRDYAEAYIKSQAQEGWQCLPDRYDDGGWTGANMERPALQRLLADIHAGKIDCVVVHKVDRLSRSLLDFARLMEIFDKHQVAFASVTQQFNTATSMGRLVLNVLLSFAQFERELISERTRDKIAAARRKGKWSGGHPLLGYDIDPAQFKLIVNEAEAAKVRAIFDLYLQHSGLIPVVQELERRGWSTKRWITRKGQERGGKPFVKTSLHHLLSNVAYLGKVRYKNEVHAGEHTGIVDARTWQRVQALLRYNRVSNDPRNTDSALLKGLVRCVPCGCAMTPSHSIGRGNKKYGYYTCSKAQKRGWQTCPSKAVPAGELEHLVQEQIRRLGRDPALVTRMVAEVPLQTERTELDREQLDRERQALERDLAVWAREGRALAEGIDDQDQSAFLRLAEVKDRLRRGKRRLKELRAYDVALDSARLGEDEVIAALARLESFWDALGTQEQLRLVRLLVQRIDYDGSLGQVKITFQASGLKTLVQEITSRGQQAN